MVATPILTAEAICHQYARRISNVARRLLSNAADVEDVTQDVFLVVVRKLDTFRGESDLSTWLHRVTVNAALQHRRRRAPQLAREVSASLQDMEDRGRHVALESRGDAQPDRQLMGRELEECIEQAVRALPEACREPFILSDIKGMPNAAIGALLGLSLATVKHRLHRARLLLRAALRPHCEEALPQADACRSVAG